jgi:hypothetical protein
MAFQETSLQARRTGSGKAFETVAKNTAGASSGGAVLWHVRPSLLNLGPQIDVRIRIVSKNKGAKNCPALKLRAIERPPWVEYYDPSASAWTETDFESVTAIRVAAPLLPKSEFVCK